MGWRQSKRRFKTWLSHRLMAQGPCPRLLPCRPLILMYHRVLPAGQAARCHTIPSIIVHEDTFAAQMAHLAAHCRPMPLADLARGALAGGLPPLCLAVTFDDGWEDTCRVALPILARYRIPATVFLTTGFVGTADVFWQERFRFLLSRLAKAHPDGPRELLAGLSPALADLPPGPNLERPLFARLAGLDEPARETVHDRLRAALGRPEIDRSLHAFLTWDQARALARAGIALGSHTARHPDLTRLPDAALTAELVDSRNTLRDRLAIVPDTLAYPTGYHDARVLAAARAAGYALAVTTKAKALRPGDDPLALPRLNVCESRFRDPAGRFDPAMFAAAVAGFF